MHAADAADADRKLDIRELRHADAAHDLLDLLFLVENSVMRETAAGIRRRRSGSEYRSCSAGAHRVRNVAQRRIACGVAAAIVDELEVVYVDQRHALHALQGGCGGFKNNGANRRWSAGRGTAAFLAARAVKQKT